MHLSILHLELTLLLVWVFQTSDGWIDAGSLLDGQSLRSGHADKRTDVSARRAGHCSWRTRDLEVRRGSAYVMLVARVASAAGGGA